MDQVMVRTFLKVYMELGSYFLFLQEQIKDHHHHAMHCPSSKQLEPPDIACKSAQVEQSDVAHKPLESGTLRVLLIQQSVSPGVACRSAVSDTRHCPSCQLLEPPDIACKSAKVEQSDVARKPAESDTSCVNVVNFLLRCKCNQRSPQNEGWTAWHAPLDRLMWLS
jgi:hypothetical protein